MFGRKNKDGNWYKTAKKLYYKGKMDAPYDSLIRYYMEIGLAVCNAVGHFEFFSMLKFDGITEKALNDLRSILPQHLLDNCLAAYEAYNALGEEPEAGTALDAMEKYDIYAAEYSNEIADILHNYVANRMTY